MTIPLILKNYEEKCLADSRRNSPFCRRPPCGRRRFNNHNFVIMARNMNWALDPRPMRKSAPVTPAPAAKAAKVRNSKQKEEEK